MSDATAEVTSIEGRVLAVQMGALRDDVRELKGAIQSLARSLEQLVRVEEQQAGLRSDIGRAFGEIDKAREARESLAKRVGAIENALPALLEMRRWVIGGVSSGVVMMLASVVSNWRHIP